MRSTFATIFAIVALLMPLAACGRDDADAAPAAGVGSAAAAPAAAAAPGPAAAEPAAAPASAPAAAAGKPAPKLTSLPTTPVPAGDLRDAYFHWDKAVVTVAAHPDTFRDEDDWSRVSEWTAVPEKGAQKLVDCDIDNPPEGKVARTTLVALRGTVRARSWATIGKVPVLELEGCEVVASSEVVATGDPWRLDGTPIPIQALYDAALGWQGKKVQVVGSYHSSTHSSAGDTQRHDLVDASGKKAVSCSHQGAAPAPQSAVDQRDGVIVEGTIGEPSFDQVNLIDCRFVNRS
jgi:hypothetical protein